MSGTRIPDKACFRCGAPSFGYLCNECHHTPLGTRVNVLRKLQEERIEVTLPKKEKLIVLCEVSR